ncbi:MAG: NADH-quinone oxidoreductase subunit L [Euryarchaeota archaeon]|nr:NADH-quinone oxidoreductase subunit L [Euryarchaeota archaeon]
MIDFRPFAYLIPILPILGFLLCLLFGKYSWRRGGMFANLTIFGSLIISLGILYNVYFQGMSFYEKSWNWFYPGIVFGIVVDPLSIVMVCMVSFVGLLIHIFAIGYMGEDPDKFLYFGETALFTGAMLGLVLSNNFIQLFLFWELVGLCSYLLIGFWWYKPEAAAAAKKAWMFCVVGDSLFLLGIVIVYNYMFSAPGITEPITFSQIFSSLETGVIPPPMLTLVSLLTLAGVCGKSAQFPLHGWIPDAMEGPTTVSALIHAATMVTAGIYLVARTFPIFMAAPNALWVVAIVGGFTALLTATMGLVVNDLKRVLAYSTISQLGYMLCMLGVGAAIGAYAVGYSIFHLISHAFFKALLFLGAGCILHGLWNIRSIKEMGGLRDKMRITSITMLIGALTLAGFPLTSGFYSKDKIIESAYEYGEIASKTGGLVHYLPWIFLIFGVFLTATYTFRMYFLAFTGKPKTYLAEHAHEPKPISSMIMPLIILAACSLIFGILTQTKFYDFLSTTFTTTTAYMSALNFEHLAKMGGNPYGLEHVETPLYIELLPTVFVFLGIGIAGYIYFNNRVDVGKYIKKGNPIYKIVWNKYHLDYVYRNLVAEKFIITLVILWDVFDLYVIDGVVNGISWLTVKSGTVIRRVQTGVVQNYATVILLGIVLLLTVIWYFGV